MDINNRNTVKLLKYVLNIDQNKEIFFLTTVKKSWKTTTDKIFCINFKMTYFNWLLY